MLMQKGEIPIFQKIAKRFLFLKSMRFQVLAALIFVGIIPVVIFSRMLLTTYRNQAINQHLAEQSQQLTVISNLVDQAGFLLGGDNQDFTAFHAEIDQIAEIYDGRIIIVDKNCRIVKDTFDGLEEGMYLVSKEVIGGFSGKESNYQDRTNEYMEVTAPITASSSKEVMGVVVFNSSIKTIYVLYERIHTTVTISYLVFSIIILLVAILYSKILVKPFGLMTESINSMTEGYMEDNLSVKGYTEVEQIADSFNHLLARLKKLETSRQEFVSNVSHELKTPITSIKVLSDSLIGQENVPIELYQEFMMDINEELERENKIINDLLSLVKMDRTASQLNIENININDLVESILKRLRPIASKRNIELVYESFRPVMAEVDEVKISLAITNLIENAIKYNQDDGWVRVSLNADHKFFYLKVADSGVGIPEDEQDSIFERFYRVDKARSRDTGGTGLGLAITRSSILLHRGAIKLHSKEQEGTTFTMRIPLSYIA